MDNMDPIILNMLKNFGCCNELINLWGSISVIKMTTNSHINFVNTGASNRKVRETAFLKNEEYSRSCMCSFHANKRLVLFTMNTK